MPDEALKIGFDIPFHEAIKAAQKRSVVLPESYYGALQGTLRQHAFSIAGITALDQLEQVRDSLAAGLQRGISFNKWKKEMLENGILDMPAHRLDNIFRTNIQNNYNRGRWEKLQSTVNARPYLMYDAINDSRVRPAHAAMDGIIRKADDSFWDSHAPSNGFRCRCRVISLSEKQAKARSGIGKGLNKSISKGKMKPDKGWDYNPAGDFQKGVKQALKNKPQSKIKGVLVRKIGISDADYSNAMPGALSTFKNITVNDINDVLKKIPGAQNRIKKLQAFTEGKGIKTLIIKQSEMSYKNKASSALESAAAEYLEKDKNTFSRLSAYTIRNASRTGGFTAASWGHVVVKGNAKINLRKNKESIALDLLFGAKKAIKDNAWSVTDAVGDNASVISTWIHEIGHQVHYWAKLPKKPPGEAITRYAEYNDKEFHAEHFSAWLLNRDALLAHDESIALYFDDLIDTAIASTTKSQRAGG